MPSVIPRLQAAMKPTLDFNLALEFERLLDDPGVSNFALGNPQEPPLAERVSTLQEALEPRDKNWFADKMKRGAFKAGDSPSRSAPGWASVSGPRTSASPTAASAPSSSSGPSRRC